MWSATTVKVTTSLEVANPTTATSQEQGGRQRPYEKSMHKSMHSIEEYAWSERQQRPSPPRGRHWKPHSGVQETTTHNAPEATFGTLDISSVLGDAKRPSYHAQDDGPEWVQLRRHSLWNVQCNCRCAMWRTSSFRIARKFPTLLEASFRRSTHSAASTKSRDR